MELPRISYILGIKIYTTGFYRMELEQILTNNKTKDNKKKIVYYAKISKMGSKKMVIIPKVYWNDIKELEEEKQIKITLEEIGE
jgi:hypothetical protein